MQRQIDEIKRNLQNIQEAIEHSKSASPSLRIFIKQKCKTALMDLEVLELELLNIKSK